MLCFQENNTRFDKFQGNQQNAGCEKRFLKSNKPEKYK